MSEIREYIIITTNIDESARLTTLVFIKNEDGDCGRLFYFAEQGIYDAQSGTFVRDINNPDGQFSILPFGTMEEAKENPDIEAALPGGATLYNAIMNSAVERFNKNNASSVGKYAVLTAAEAAKRWGMPYVTVSQACTGQHGCPPKFGRFECRQSGKTWLISYDAMKRVYGPEWEFRLHHGEQETHEGDIEKR